MMTTGIGYSIRSFGWLIVVLQLACGSINQDGGTGDSWTLGPFQKSNASNPVLIPQSIGQFFCPIREDSVRWEIKDVFNPAAVVKDDMIYLIYRAEDTVGRHAGTSRIGLAYSSDGLHFQRRPRPVLYPDRDFMMEYEWEGGCEDPRVVESSAGTYILTYTAYDGKLARLCVASSSNLIDWTKHGLAFGKSFNGKFKDVWSKSGSIVCRLEGDRMIATMIDGFYWMYWGDTQIFAARSEDLINWMPVTDEHQEPVPVFGPRPGKFDSDLVEPGPPALIRENGILLIYNSRNKGTGGDPELPEGTYAAGQILMEKEDPMKVESRTEDYFLVPDQEYEITGQIGNVCFVEGLVFFEEQWWIYYGTADSKIAAAKSTITGH